MCYGTCDDRSPVGPTVNVDNELAQAWRDETTLAVALPGLLAHTLFIKRIPLGGVSLQNSEGLNK